MPFRYDSEAAVPNDMPSKLVKNTAKETAAFLEGFLKCCFPNISPQNRVGTSMESSPAQGHQPGENKDHIDIFLQTNILI